MRFHAEFAKFLKPRAQEEYSLPIKWLFCASASLRALRVKQHVPLFESDCFEILGFCFLRSEERSERWFDRGEAGSGVARAWGE
jgi:hypothetical protein